MGAGEEVGSAEFVVRVRIVPIFFTLAVEI